MKNSLTLVALSAFLCLTSFVNAETSHQHSHEVVGGPKGGRILEHTEPQAEFFVEKDKTITITFYDKEMKPVPAEGQNVVIIADQNGVKTKVEFEKKGDVLTSKEKLPDGTAPHLVVQFKQTADAKPSNFRFVLEEELCGVCKRAEYACICEH